MHTQTVERLTHDHAFNQDHKNKAELKSLIVVALTLITMVVEIAAGLMYGSMALLADWPAYGLARGGLGDYRLRLFLCPHQSI